MVEIYLKRKNEIYIPTFVDVNELREGDLKERDIVVNIKDVVSTKVDPIKEPPASAQIPNKGITYNSQTTQQVLF